MSIHDVTLFRTIGFRCLLPFLMTAVHIWLISGPNEIAQRSLLPSEYRAATFQEGGVVRFEPRPGPRLSHRARVAIALNLPAFVVAAFLKALLLKNAGASPDHTLYLTTAFIPLLWFAVGGWLDALLGWQQRQLPSASVARSAVRVFVMAIAGIALFLSLYGLTPLHHHRQPDADWFLLGWAFWSAIALLIATSVYWRPDYNSRRASS